MAAGLAVGCARHPSLAFEKTNHKPDDERYGGVGEVAGNLVDLRQEHRTTPDQGEDGLKQLVRRDHSEGDQDQQDRGYCNAYLQGALENDPDEETDNQGDEDGNYERYRTVGQEKTDHEGFRKNQAVLKMSVREPGGNRDSG